MSEGKNIFNMMIISLQDVLSCRSKRALISARLLRALRDCGAWFVVTLLFSVPIHSTEMNPLQHRTGVIASAPSPERARALRYLLKHDCGSCHGMTLKGGLGPALTREALKGRSRSEIASVILHGRASLAMPPWSPFLSPDEALWLAGLLKEEFKEEW